MDTSHLKRAQDLLVFTDSEWCAKGARNWLSAAMPCPNVFKPERLDKLTLAVRAIGLAESNMLTAMERLEWMQAQADQIGHIKSRWPYYVGEDIEYWHVQLRSSLDQVAFVMAELANKKGQVSCKFRKLYKQCHLNSEDGHRFAENLGNDWLTLLQSATWFDQIVAVRDELVHRGGWTLVSGQPSDGIIFQVHGPRSRMCVCVAPLMANKNAVYFERYAAHLMAHFVVFLEDFARIVPKRIGIPLFLNETGRACHPGYAVLRSWIQSTLVAAEAVVERQGVEPMIR